ncbi:MAG: LON peptidase substrate-binding domain-containing protein [Burkholderiales bacterium]|nr:LON peptidase substrate-binding domain-containing protein [Burkholderiales bacterium]PZN00214.1 MAG: peptidase S16 [Pseudomonadota bacterium]
MAERTALDIPLFPLHAVLFPGGRLPLRVFETRYMDMTRDCLREGQPFGVCLIKHGKEVGEIAVPEDIGCLAHIAEWDMQQLGVLHVRASGGLRFRILETQASGNGLLRASVEPIAPEPELSVPDRLLGCANLLRLVAADGDKVQFDPPHRFDDAAWVGYRLTEILPVPLIAKQKLLELNDPIVRLEILHRFLEQRGLLTSG